MAQTGTLQRHPRLGGAFALTIAAILVLELILLTFEAIRTWQESVSGDEVRLVAEASLLNVLFMVGAIGIGIGRRLAGRDSLVVWLAIAALLGVPGSLFFAVIEAALHS